MKVRTLGILAIVAVLALAGAAVAGDKAAPVTVEGKLLCAKCTLEEAGQEKCQSVVVAGDQKYYLVKNAIAEKDGHVCKGEKAVKVTGVVSEKDGRKWIEATEIAEVKS